MYKRLIVTFLILADGLLSAFARQARDVINLNNGEIYQYPLVVVEVCGGERHFENIVLLKLGYEF